MGVMNEAWGPLREVWHGGRIEALPAEIRASAQTNLGLCGLLSLIHI